MKPLAVVPVAVMCMIAAGLMYRHREKAMYSETEGLLRQMPDELRWKAQGIK
jgi:hypothetical protein